MKQSKSYKKLVTAAFFMAIGIILPFFTAQLKAFGASLLPMHLPVMLCGFVCGWKYGLIVGLIMPIFRGAVFGMPVLFPNSLWMAPELATYGFVCGFVYMHAKGSAICKSYLSLTVAMVAGRAVWGVLKAVILGFSGQSFTMQMFVAGGVLNAVPGIVLQLVIIPPVVTLIEKIQRSV